MNKPKLSTEVLDEPSVSDETNQENQRQIVIHNDESNTFDYVIKCLCTILKHNTCQAEQCTYIIHYNGKCGVKSGTFEILKPLKDALIDRGLSATIE